MQPTALEPRMVIRLISRQLAGPVLPSLTDVDGNTYAMVQIGTQKWMAESLRTTHYGDGSPIATGLENEDWKATTSGAYATNPYANLSYYYNWYALTDARKICPAGSHAPTKEEWQELFNYLGGASVAALKMKSTTYWDYSPGTNSSGFNAYGAGFREYDGSGTFVSQAARFGSSTSTAATQYYAPMIIFNDIDETPRQKGAGTSVRCIGD